MARAFLIVLFVMTGVFPLCLGMYATTKQDYFIGVSCLIISVFGFLQVYQNSSVEELLESLRQIIADQDKALDEQKAELSNHKEEITQKLADVFAAKVEHQEKIIVRQRKELSQAAKFLEYKNREIRLLREDYDD